MMRQVEVISMKLKLKTNKQTKNTALNKQLIFATLERTSSEETWGWKVEPKG